MAPTAAGSHCTTCHTEVVDFTKLSEAEILAYLAARPSRQPVCAYVQVSQLEPAPASRWRRWLLAGLAALGWSMGALAQQPPAMLPQPVAAEGENSPLAAQVIVRGQVCDDQGGVPAINVQVLIKGTKYGALTDHQGRFELVMAAAWKPLRSGILTLQVVGRSTTFQPQDIRVEVRGRSLEVPIELSIMLQSVPDRRPAIVIPDGDFVMGKMRFIKPPLAPPRQ